MSSAKEVLSELKALYEKKSLIPFIGAGFSIPLNLPNWAELIGMLGTQLGYEKDIFLDLGSFQQLAEYVKKEQPKEWKRFLLNVLTQFNSVQSHEMRKSSIQHQALASLDFSSIYTTNYDLHIEQALSDIGKKVIAISTYQDFLKSRDDEYGCEVLKFHGSLEEQETIILTESQYFGRMDLEGAIDQRLRSDALTNSFLFIGYSFSDPNIRYIFYKLHKLREQISNDSKTINSYLATFGMNEIQTKLLRHWGIKVINLDPSDKEKSISELLYSIG